MKHLTFCLFLEACLLSGFTQATAQPAADAREVLLKTASLLKEKHLFRYEADYRIKYFDYSDTSALSKFDCIVVKAPGDSILGFWAKLSDATSDRIYDGVNFLMIWHEPKKLLRDNPHLTGKKFTNNNIQKTHIPGFIHSDQPFYSYLNDAEQLRLSDTLFNGRKCWKVDVFYPANDEITFMKRVVFIDQETRLPFRVEGYAKFQDVQDEYWELNLSELHAESNKSTSFSAFYTYPENYAEEDYVAPNFNFERLPIGSPWIAIEGRELSGNPYSMASVGTKDVVLLDFWYLACGPCMKAMPDLARLYNIYKERGLQVLGLNPFDDPVIKSGEIEKFKSRFGVAYPLIFVNKTIAETYQAKSFPTVYLIHKGQVVFSDFGYSKEKMAELENKIVELLEQ